MPQPLTALIPFRRASEGGSAASAAALRLSSRQTLGLTPFPACSSFYWRLLSFSSGNREPPAGKFNEAGRRSRTPSSRRRPLAAQADCETHENRDYQECAYLLHATPLDCRTPL